MHLTLNWPDRTARPLFFSVVIFFLLAAAPNLRAYSSSLLSGDTIFYDDFESGVLDPQFWTPRPGAGGGLIAVEDSLGNTPIAYAGRYALQMGRVNDGNFTVLGNNK